jgi:uncharacterized membrane protein YqiK
VKCFAHGGQAEVGRLRQQLERSVPRGEAEAAREEARAALLEAERLRRLAEGMVPRAEMEVQLLFFQF